MGDFSEANTEMVGSSPATPVQLRKEVYSFDSTNTGEVLCAKISFEVLSEECWEDTGTDIAIELAEAIHRVMVGRFKFAPIMDKKEHRRGDLEDIPFTLVQP